MHRTIVGLRNRNGNFTVPKFSDCLLEFFAKDINSMIVKCTAENDILVLNESDEGHELRHSPECPFKLKIDLSDHPDENNRNKLKTLNIGLAASVIVESSDSHVLLTKRPAHMRSSPNVWVFPGGHLESGETIFEAGVRELKEETGLNINIEKASILGIWENVYPLLKGLGPPKYHVLVIYLHTCLNETHKELTQKIFPEPEEVDSYCWLNASVIAKLLNPTENVKCDGKQYIFKNGKTIENYLDYCSMFNRWLTVQAEPYSGVNFALRKWMEKVKDAELQIQIKIKNFTPPGENTRIIIKKKHEILYFIWKCKKHKSVL